MQIVTEKDLKNEISDMRERFPRLQDSELFVAWFLKSFVIEREDEAVRALVGGSRDKSLDALLIDDAARVIFLVQGKYRQKASGATEHRSDVTAFADLANTFSNDDSFKSWVKDLDAGVAGKALEARQRIKKRGYRLQLYYVTTGRCSSSLSQEAERMARQADAPADIDVVHGKRVLRLLSDYLDGVAPPVPLLDLEIESGQGVKLSGVLQRFDGNTEIESWVIPVNVRHVAEMYEAGGVRLFARNVRGFLENTPINRNMEATLEREPEFFWYYNNGITIICDDAQRLSRGGRDIIRVVNPQIINGQQTTRTLHKRATRNSKATVLVRVISVPRESDEDSARFAAMNNKKARLTRAGLCRFQFFLA
jgi:AIPR protein